MFRDGKLLRLPNTEALFRNHIFCINTGELSVLYEF